MTYPPPPIDDFAGLVAVVTGGGTGMGRALCVQLASAGCHVAMCDLFDDSMAETLALARAANPEVRVTSFVADVSSRQAVDAFAQDVAEQHGTDHVNMVFNNAGIGGGASTVAGIEAEWDRVFGVCFGGVLNGTRAFLPLLLESERGQVVNTSSVNGFWACLGPTGPHTAYSAAKFAVKGFTESLMVDFRVHAPHLTAAVVMPGHIGTQIPRNSRRILDGEGSASIPDRQLAAIRAQYAAAGTALDGIDDDDLRTMIVARFDDFENNAPTTAGGAATIILDGVRSGSWRILVGDDAVALDERVRNNPTEAYGDTFAGLAV